MSLFALAERAASAPPPPSKILLPEADQPGGQAEPVPPPAPVTAALKRLVDFIPTETITLFWLAVPAARSLAEFLKVEEKPNWTDWAAFGLLLALTPFLLLLAYRSALASQNRPRPPLREWPWWRALASTIAFAAWAPAVPGNPFIAQPALLMTAWFVATLVSIVLGLLDPIITQPRQS